MTPRQLAEAIGSIDEKYPAAAQRPPKRRRLWPRIVSAAAAFAIVLGCVSWLALRAAPTNARARDLMEGVTPSAGFTGELTEAGSDAVAEFGLSLLRTVHTGGNDLISPLSVASALGMTANGAAGETLAQMESVLGMDAASLASHLAAYLRATAGDELSNGNSIWFRDNPELTVNPEFLQRNADTYNAGALAAPFDRSTVRAINSWVSERTNDMIRKIVNGIPDEAMLYLINALAFEAKWEHPYRDESRVRKGEFQNADGTSSRVTYLRHGDAMYLEDSGAVGLMKYYQDRRFAFAALLPPEGTALEDYAAALTGGRLRQILKSAEELCTDTSIPKFEMDFSYELSDALAAMGMTDAFDPDIADLTPMGDCPGGLYIGNVVHKTHIELGEDGTRAAAVTSVQANGGSAPPEFRRDVYLERPFLYMIVDTETMTPVFIGMMEKM